MLNRIPLLTGLIRRLLKRNRERFPRLLSIEITSRCNANCIMCPRAEMSRPKVDMELGLFEKILADCRGKPLKKVNLFWFGESLSHKDVLTFLRRARTALPGVRLYLSTNAGGLTAERSDAILGEGLLDVINFDIDGVQASTYERIRRGVSYANVIENVEYFLARKKELGLREPTTRATIIRMKETDDEVEAFREKWTGRVDRIEVNAYNTWLSSQEDRNVGRKLQESRESSFHTVCDHPWNELVISAEGEAGLCCLDYDLTAPLGSVHDLSIEDIWRGEILSAYREKILDYRYDRIDCCSRCNAYIYQTRSLWSRVWARRS